MRRRALDRLLVQYLELPPDQQAGFLRRCRLHHPRLAAWLEQMVADRHTVSMFSDAAERVADEALAESGTTARELPQGYRLGPWRILEAVGHGGMGMVYRGERADGAFDKHVAIKLIARRRSGLADLLKRESRLLARLDHPAITRLLDAGIDGTAGPFLAMEWVEGTDLDRWIDENDPDTASRLEIFEEIARALTHAHQRLVVHGDIKPGNVRIGADGTVKLMDFGVARLLSDETGDSNDAHALTPAFAAPEQMHGQAPSPHSDIWSMGALLGWMLSGIVPGREEHDSIIGQLTNQLDNGPELAAVLETACAPDPEARYGSIGELATEIRAWRTHHPVTALPQTRGYRLRKFVRRNRALVAATTALFIALIAGTAVSTGLYLQAQNEADRARAATERTVAVKDFLANMISAADVYVNPGEVPTVRDILDESHTTIAERFQGQPDIAAELLGVVGTSFIGLGEKARAREALADAMAIMEADTATEVPLHTAAEIRYAYAHALRSKDAAQARRLAREALDQIGHLSGMEKLRSDLKGLMAYFTLMEEGAEKAIPQLEQARDLACSAEPVLVDPCINRLGDLTHYYARLGKVARQLESAETAYRMARERHGTGPHPQIIGIGTAYSRALANAGHPRQAIETAEQMLEDTRVLYDESNVRHAWIRYPLANAYSRAGKTHRAWPIQKQALDIAAEATPGSNAIAVQLNALLRMLLDLHMLEEADEAIDHYAEAMPESPPSFAHRELAFLQLRRTIKGAPESDHLDRLKDFAARMKAESDHLLLANTRLIGLEQAIDSGDRETAESWLGELLDSRVELLPAWAREAVEARFHLLQNKPRRAMTHVSAGLEELKESGEQNGPRFAQLRAIGAESHCRVGEITDGRRMLEQAMEYWRETAGVAAGKQAMRRIAASCDQNFEIERHH